MTTTTQNTIAVTDAAIQLGIEELEFRKLLKGLYKNPNTIKKISVENFKTIAETMQERATEETQPELESTILETETETENTEDLPVEAEESPIQTEDLPVEAESISLATTDPQALDISQDKAKTLLNINLNLSNQVLDLNKITSALAIIAGEAAVKNFQEIYTHTVNAGIDKIIESVAQQTYSTIQALREVDNSAFLEQNGRLKPVETQSAINLVCQFL